MNDEKKISLNKAKNAQQKASGYKAQYKYTKEHKKSVIINLNRDTDADILEWWARKKGKAAWFRETVRREIEKDNL